MPSYERRECDGRVLVARKLSEGESFVKWEVHLLSRAKGWPTDEQLLKHFGDGGFGSGQVRHAGKICLVEVTFD